MMGKFTREKVLILGTSNCLIKGGFSDYLNERFDVENISIGASCSLNAIFLIKYYGLNLLNYDHIVIDFTITDNEHLIKDWIEPSILEESILNLYSMLSNLCRNIVVVVYPTRNYLDKEFEHKGSQLAKYFANQFRFEIIDGYSIINKYLALGGDINKLYKDNAHLNTFSAAYIAKAVTLKINENSYRNQKGSVFKEWQVLKPEDFGMPTIKRTSSVWGGNFGIIKENEVFSTNYQGYVYGFFVDANLPGIIKLSSSSVSIIKNMYSGVLKPGKLQARFICLHKPIYVNGFELSVTSDSSLITEDSPGKVVKGTSIINIAGVLCSNDNESVSSSVIHENQTKPLTVSSNVELQIGQDMYDEFGYDNYLCEQYLSKNIIANNADALREIALIFENVEKIPEAFKLIEKAYNLRPEGELIQSIYNRLKIKYEMSYMLSSEKI